MAVCPSREFADGLDQNDPEVAQDVRVAQDLGRVVGAAVGKVVAEPHEVATLLSRRHQHGALAMQAGHEGLHVIMPIWLTLHGDERGMKSGRGGRRWRGTRRVGIRAGVSAGRMPLADTPPVWRQMTSVPVRMR